jgi:nucleotide-binding universal stress UspA family protein
MKKLLYLIPNQNINPAVAAYIAQVAARMKASVHLLIAADTQKVLDAAVGSLEEARPALAEVELTTASVLDDPVKAMQAAQAEQAYEMMLVGVPRRRRLIPSNFRLLSNRLIKRSLVPVMLVRNVSKKLDRMLVCTGGIKVSNRVVVLSAKLAGEADLSATLMTVLDAVPSMYTGMDEIEETLPEILTTDTPLAQHLRTSAEVLTGRGIDAEVKVRHGDVVEAILEEVAEGAYDLVVMGATEGGSLRGMLLGNVSQQIINRSPCAVLIAK